MRARRRGSASKMPSSLICRRHRARIDAPHVEAALEQRPRRAARCRPDLDGVLARLRLEPRPPDRLLDLRPRARRRLRRDRDVRDAAGIRAAARVVAVPADEDAVGARLRQLARRRDHVEDAIACARLDVVDEAAGCRGAQLRLERPRPGADDRRIALVGGAIGIALEDVERERAGAEGVGEREHLGGGRGAAERAAIGAGERARDRLVGARGVDLERGEAGAREREPQVGAALGQLPLDPAGDRGLVEQPDEARRGQAAYLAPSGPSPQLRRSI